MTNNLKNIESFKLLVMINKCDLDLEFPFSINSIQRK